MAHMQKTFAYTQLLIGLVGLARCGLLYACYTAGDQQTLSLITRELTAFASLVPWAISQHGLRLCLIGRLNTENKA